MNTKLGLILMAVTVLLIVLTIFMIKKEPRRIFNGFLVECIIILLIVAIVCIVPTTDIWMQILRIAFILYYCCFILISVELFVNGIRLLRKERLCLAHVLPLAFGVCSLVVGLCGLWDLFNGMVGSEFTVIMFTFMFNLVTFIPMAFGVVFNYMWIYKRVVHDANVDYIIVLGCSIRRNGEVTPLLKGRLDKAIEWYQKGQEKAMFIVSGGQGSDEVISEAEAMKNYLLQKNIPADKILLENKSTTTNENLTFSKTIIEQRNSGSKCLVATSSYHVLRAVTIAKKIGLDANAVGGKTAAYYYPAAFFREYIAMIFGHKYVIGAYILISIILTWMNF